jgi:hypothetical protein
MSKSKVDADESVKASVFAGLGKNRCDEAIDLFWTSSMENVGVPMPRTRKYIKMGEWDARQRLIIKLMPRTNYWGCIGVAGANTCGTDRFCGKCNFSIASHKRDLLDSFPQRWYIQAGTRSTAGFFAEPSLPSFENGDPIPKTFEARLRDPSLSKFTGLTLGQCKLFVDDWKAGR